LTLVADFCRIPVEIGDRAVLVTKADSRNPSMVEAEKNTRVEAPPGGANHIHLTSENGSRPTDCRICAMSAFTPIASIETGIHPVAMCQFRRLLQCKI
jgi:hypothetical protein